MTGVVRSVIVPPKGSGKQTSLDVDWSFGSEIKRRIVKICNVQLCYEKSGPSFLLRDAPAEQSEPGRTQTEGRFLEPDVICVNNDSRTSPHSTKWVEEEINHSLNGFVLPKAWSASHITEQHNGENQSRNGLRPYDYFTWMFPIHHLESIVTLSNPQLAMNTTQQTNGSEILKFFGILVLMSRHQFGPRRGLWLSVGKFKYISAPNFVVIMPNIALRHRGPVYVSVTMEIWMAMDPRIGGRW